MQHIVCLQLIYLQYESTKSLIWRQGARDVRKGSTVVAVVA